ncbi:MAG: NADH:flavin oxidoreductase/NADH oxidase [Gammaproteobacteria bacterium]|nr:NADH:flavin oxidoreductase/NADH oxidase [Gammaproteobacteria bacterium]
MSHLFTPLTLRGVTFSNRIFMAPMCQYSAKDGLPNDWHRTHYATRAIGGVGSIILEATAVTPEGRITAHDLGLWNDQQTEAMKPLVDNMVANGVVPGIQLAHAGRKGDSDVPWRGGKGMFSSDWKLLAPSAIAFDENHETPVEMSSDDMDAVEQAFVDAAKRSLQAGFKVVELHMAHGYLLHQFLSPLSNQRSDEYGGSLENRMRYPLRITKAVREVWPDDLPLFVRLSATDWAEDAWDLEQSIVLCRELKAMGVDLIDVSSGGLVGNVKIPLHPGYQVPFADEIKRQVEMPTGSVGLITEVIQAEQIVATGQADSIFLARELLRNPYWPQLAAKQLGADISWPPQYERAPF